MKIFFLLCLSDENISSIMYNENIFFDNVRLKYFYSIMFKKNIFAIMSNDNIYSIISDKNIFPFMSNENIYSIISDKIYFHLCPMKIFLFYNVR